MTAQDHMPSPDSNPDALPNAPPSPGVAYRLNILALPTRTTLLFLLIVLVVYLPIFAAQLGITPVCAPFILFWMILLPLRHFLQRPERIVQTQQLEDAQVRHPALQQAIDILSTRVADIHPPALLLSPDPSSGPYTFGALRRTYLAVSAKTAAWLERALNVPGSKYDEPGQALIFHELAHIKHNDIALALFARSLLLVTIGFMSISWFVHLWTPSLYAAMLDFYDMRALLPPAVLEWIARDNPNILLALDPNFRIESRLWLYYEVWIMSAHLPLIVASFALLIIFWPALMRTRELYADARAVQWQMGKTQPLWDALELATLFTVIQNPARGVKGAIERIRNNVRKWKGVGFLTLRRWRATHPNDKTREAALARPHEIYGNNWAIGLTAGAAFVLLNLSLYSLFSSQYIRGPNSIPPITLGFTVIALSLLPFLCQYRGTLKELLPRVTSIVFIFTAIKLIPQYLAGLFLAAAILTIPSVLDQIGGTMVGAVLPPGSLVEMNGYVLEYYVVRPAILFTLIMPLLLIACVLLDAWLKQRVLRWFSAGFVTRHPGVVFWSVTLGLDLILIFLILPVVDYLTVPLAHDLSEFNTTISMIAVALLALGGVVFFYLLDRRHHNHCPHCHARVTASYALGMSCQNCGTLLNRWLVTA